MNLLAEIMLLSEQVGDDAVQFVSAGRAQFDDTVLLVDAMLNNEVIGQIAYKIIRTRPVELHIYEAGADKPGFGIVEKFLRWTKRNGGANVRTFVAHQIPRSEPFWKKIGFTKNATTGYMTKSTL